MLNQVLDGINSINWPVMVSRMGCVIWLWVAEWVWKWKRRNDR